MSDLFRGVGRMLGAFLHGVSAGDPPTIASVAGLLFVISFFASGFPR